MGCRILGDTLTCFYDSVTMTPFGPIATKEQLEEFKVWLDRDPRAVFDINNQWEEWLEEQDGD